jgi:uncharacterized RDD family membrane protein YckC
MKSDRKGNTFNPHETARAQALAGVPLATFGQRFAAIAIDFFLVYATYLPAVAIFQYVVTQKLHVQEDVYHTAHVQVKIELDKFTELAKVIWFILYFGLIAWKTNGLTPGKRLLRIRVVSLTHERITLWQATERALGYGASALEAGFGFFQYFIYPNRCCVHDRIAETIVVKERRGTEAAALDAPSQEETA